MGPAETGFLRSVEEEEEEHGADVGPAKVHGVGALVWREGKEDAPVGTCKAENDGTLCPDEGKKGVDVGPAEVYGYGALCRKGRDEGAVVRPPKVEGDGTPWPEEERDRGADSGAAEVSGDGSGCWEEAEGGVSVGSCRVEVDVARCWEESRDGASQSPFTKSTYCASLIARGAEAVGIDAGGTSLISSGPSRARAARPAESSALVQRATATVAEPRAGLGSSSTSSLTASSNSSSPTTSSSYKSQSPRRMMSQGASLISSPSPTATRISSDEFGARCACLATSFGTGPLEGEKGDVTVWGAEGNPFPS